MADPFRIAFVFDRRTVDEWRAYFLTAHRFAQTQPDWHILHKGGYTCLNWDYALTLKPDGILATLDIDYPVPVVTSPRTRVVIANNSVADHPFRRVIIDGIASGQSAAAHLLSRGLRTFAYIGWSIVGYSEEQRQGFTAAIEQAGFASSLHVVDLHHPEGEQFVPPPQWFNDLPKPCGIACAHDGLAGRILDAARAAGFAVPNDIAVMGIGDDEIQCVQSHIPLTSVSRDLFKQGLGAAQFLNRWLRDDTLHEQVVRYPPGEVMERQSTRMFGEPDPIVRRALLLIHTPSATPMTVERLLDQMGNVSRRRMEILFRQQMGRTPYQEILRARIELTKKLLRSTTLSIDEIAYQVGFSNSAHISRPFKIHTGYTPTAYRHQHSHFPTPDLL